ncbi:hypothetical protein ACTXT7_010705 [Hymenolepis weldensis]
MAFVSDARSSYATSNTDEVIPPKANLAEAWHVKSWVSGFLRKIRNRPSTREKLPLDFTESLPSALTLKLLWGPQIPGNLRLLTTPVPASNGVNPHLKGIRAKTVKVPNVYRRESNAPASSTEILFPNATINKEYQYQLPVVLLLVKDK